MARTYTISKYRISYVKERDTASLDQRKVINRKDAVEVAKRYLSDLPYESFIVMGRNSSGNVIGISAVEGVPNQCTVLPSNVFRFLLSCGAVDFVIAHNHPGGRLSPSEADWNVTGLLKTAGRVLEIPLQDHLLITETGTVSFKELGRWQTCDR